MSFATILGPIRRAEPIVGGFNILDGLHNFRQALAYVKQDRANTGFGGLDVVDLGDSIRLGSGAAHLYVDGQANLLRQLLQMRFNPEDIKPGGYGFVPWVTPPPTAAFVGNSFLNVGADNMRVDGAAANWDFFGLAAAYTGEAGDSKGICLRHASTASALSAQTAAWMYLNSQNLNSLYTTASASRNMTAKQCQIVYSAKSGNGRFKWIHGPLSGGDPYVGTPPATPSNAFGETIDQNSAEAVGLRSSLSDVATSTAATHYVQVDQLDASARIDIEGLIHYNGDADRGIRYHSLGCGGALSGSYNDAVTLAGLARFGANLSGGANATGAKLVIIGLGTNDCGVGGSPTNDVATFIANLTILIDSIQAWASQPSILLWFPPCRNDSGALGRWRDYIEAAKALALQKNCALLDFWAKVRTIAGIGDQPHGAGSAGGWMFDRGFYNDGVHYASKAQDWFARETFAAIAAGT